jgi:transposase InsO family protein
MVRGLPPISHAEQFCDTCVLAKHRRGVFPKQSKYRTDKALELVHGDLRGPVKPVTPGGRRYFQLLVDDATRYMWVVLLTAKSEASSAIKRIQAAAEKKCGRKLRVLRTDNGGEFTAAEFTAYCADKGITQTLFGTIHPTTEQGGGAAKSDYGDNGAGAPKTAEDAGGILRGGCGHRGLPTEPAPNEKSHRSHTL